MKKLTADVTHLPGSHKHRVISNVTIKLDGKPVARQEGTLILTSAGAVQQFKKDPKSFTPAFGYNSDGLALIAKKAA